jgi:hypothetical protein
LLSFFCVSDNGGKVTTGIVDSKLTAGVVDTEENVDLGKDVTAGMDDTGGGQFAAGVVNTFNQVRKTR